MISGCLDIDVVHTDSSPADDFEIFRHCNDLSGDTRVGSDCNCIRVLCQLEDLFGGGPVGFYNVKTFLGFEQINTDRRNAVCD